MAKAMESLLKWLLFQSDKLDERLRFHDFYAHRTVDGRLDGLFHINRHTLGALTLPCLVCGLMVLASPSSCRVLMAIISLMVVGGILTWFMRRSAEKNWPVQADLVAQSFIVLLTAAVIWTFGQDEYQDHGLYRHVFVALAALMAITFLLAAGLIGSMFKRIQAQNLDDAGKPRYGEYLRRTELFASRGKAPDVTLGTILSSSVTVLLRSPLALFTIPAIVALVSPTAFIWYFTLLALAICFLGLILAAINERFGAMWTQLQSAFFRGAPLLISLIVIVLGAARLSGNTYVTPIFDTAAWHTLGVTFVSAYVLSWWYDYWTNRLLVDRIMVLLDPAAAGIARIPYAIYDPFVATRVPANERFVQVHGSGRVLAIRENTVIHDTQGNIVYQGPVFQAYALADVIKLVALSGAPGGKENPTLAQVRSRILNFHSVLVLAFATLITGVGLWLHFGKQSAEATVPQSSQGLKLVDMLNARRAAAPDSTLVVIAGSGGGTRAALYTASILEGITAMGKANDIVLASGVSGGGASLAYFASNRDLLTSPDERVRKRAWDVYFDNMKQPYIQDVLDRASEWRMAASGRLGQLLDGSFKDHWKLREGHQTLSEIKDMGLIFNTSLGGHLVVTNGDLQHLEDNEPRLRKDTKPTLAGGRLLLTNLALPGLTGAPLEPQGANQPLPQLPVIVRGNNLRLEDAAALNSNFPPVFSNAAVDVDREIRDKDPASPDAEKQTAPIDQPIRYWVTDGGVEDNRGMEMMLSALLQALKSIKADKLPRLLIVVADASAFSDQYSQDRGISSTMGAGSHFASHLDAELYERIEALYAGTDKLHFAYVMMPDHLRESGSFGTHWMLQSWIRVHGSVEPDQKQKSVVITGEEMIQVLRALHDPDPQRKLSSDPGTVLDWSRKDCGHQDGWATVVNTLNPSRHAASCEIPKDHAAIPVLP